MVVKNYRLFITKGSDYTQTNGVVRSGYGDYDNGLREYILLNTTYNGEDGSWNSGWRVIPGLGSTPATINDYYVETESGLTFRGCTVNPLVGNQNYNITSTWSNETANDITVREVVFCCRFTPQYNQMTTAIIARKVLQTPVTIAPGEQYSFTYIITMNL